MNLSLADKKLKQEDFRNKLLEKDSLIYSVSVIFPSPDNTDSFDETSSLTSQNTVDRASVDISCFDYRFDEITHSNGNLHFLENTEESEFSDCLSSVWPEIGNFEDVDMMFRSSDSTFGFGPASNEYVSCSFSSASIKGGTKHVSKADLKQHVVNDHKEQFKHNELLGKAPVDEPGTSGKQIPHLSGNFGDVARVSHVSSPAEGFFNVQEITTKRSGSGDVSQEASSFCQLQLVMEQLDLKTKICMKDNLYRLARSAEQRRKQHVNSNEDCGIVRDPNGARMAKRKHGYTSFMDVETARNSICRSIAHLLFYAPSESSAIGA